MNNLAWNLALAGTNLDEAVKLIETALQKEPGNPLFVDTRGMIYFRNGKLDNALTAFQDAVRADAGSATFRLHLAQALMARGQRQKAHSELETAMRSRPEAAEVRTIQELLKETS